MDYCSIEGSVCALSDRTVEQLSFATGLDAPLLQLGRV